MAEEVRLTGYDAGGSSGSGGEEEDERVSEWEDGLPNGDDLMPLSQSLISLELLSAFNITPEPYRSVIDVNRASQNTLSDLRGDSEQPSLTRVNGLKQSIHNKGDETVDLTPGGSDYRKLNRIGSGGDGYGDGGVEIANLALGGPDYRKLHKIGSSGDGGVETVDLDLGGDGDGDVDGGGAVEETEIETETETETETVTEYDLQVDDPSTRASKRPRLVWTPQLHKRFIEVVAHLGVKSAVPKTIMQLMNVEGLTRENVASHLQKYRLYLKRMQDVPQRLHDSGGSGGGGGSGYRPAPAAVPMTYRQQMVNHMAYNMDSVYQHGNSNSNSNGNGNGNGNSVTPNNK